MKNLRTSLVCACLACLSLGSFAQNKTIPINEPDLNKPKLFANLPDRIPVTAADLDNLFGSDLGRPANLSLSMDAKTKFEGDVVSRSERSREGIQSVVIRSTNYNGARLTVSRRELPDGSFVYTGRILSFKHGDLYELQTLQGQLVLVKRNFYDLVNE